MSKPVVHDDSRWNLPAFLLGTGSRAACVLDYPLHSNAINLTYGFNNVGLDFNGVVPINGATGTYSVPSFGYYHSFSLFGRSANIQAGLPYGIGTFQGSVLGTNQDIYRSGLLDLGLRTATSRKIPSAK